MSNVKKFPTGVMQNFLLGMLSYGFNNCNYLNISVLLRGNIGYDKLEEAINVLVRKHPALRTSLERTEKGFVQVVDEDAAYTLNLCEAQGSNEQEKTDYVKKAISEKLAHPADPFKDELTQIIVYRISDEVNIVAFVCNHLISDAQSLMILYRDLLSYLASGNEPEDEELTFADYCIMETDPQNDAVRQESARFWVNEMAKMNGRSITMLPEADAEEEISVTVSGDLREKVSEYAKKMHVSVFQVVESAFDIAISRIENTPSSSLRIAIANRFDERLKNTVGFFATAINSYSEVRDDISVDDFVTYIRNKMIDYSKHMMGINIAQLTPFRNEKDKIITPYILSYMDYAASSNLSTGGSFTAEAIQPEDKAVYPKAIFIKGKETKQEIALEASYDCKIFTADYVRSFMESVRSIIGQIVTQNGKMLGDIEED